MGLFNSKKEGGIMDTIQCEKKDFLIWKWRPNADGNAGGSRKENTIRYGSSLVVGFGQAAVIFYENEGQYEVIEGPRTVHIKTENLPILSSIIGAAYAGGTPFPAQVYFIDVERGMQLPFVIPFFRVVPSEPEYKPYNIEVAIKGAMQFMIPRTQETMKYFLESWGGHDTTLAEFEDKVKSLLTQEVKHIVANAPKDTGIFIMHFNQLQGEIGKYIAARIRETAASRFGVFVSGVTIDDIRYDEDGEGYQKLKRLTEDQAQLFNLENEKNTLLSYEIQRETMRTDADVRNMTAKKMADVQMSHMEDMAARMREESQFAQHMQSEQAAKQAGLASESEYINAHSINKQAEVLKAGMENMGQMGSMNMSGAPDGHMNPAGMMTGMMMGAAVGGQAANMMNQMGQTMQQNMASAGKPMQGPPPIPNQQQVSYFLAINGQQYGPCDANAVAQMVASNQINGDTLGWCNGMSGWEPIKQIPGLASLFAQPSMPGCPPPIPTK